MAHKLVYDATTGETRSTGAPTKLRQPTRAIAVREPAIKREVAMSSPRTAERTSLTLEGATTRHRAGSPRPGEDRSFGPSPEDADVRLRDGAHERHEARRREAGDDVRAH